MPHQCVKCGAIYPNGSKEILTGCSVCGGRVFYYISEEAAKQAQGQPKVEVEEEVKTNLESIVEKILQEPPQERYNEMGEVAEDGEWVKIKPEELSHEDRKRVERIEKLRKKTTASVVDSIEVSSSRNVEDRMAKKKSRARRKVRVRKHAYQEEVDFSRPEVITVVDRGVYEINLKLLLENSPIIVQKDGSYLIHLPSLFESTRKKKQGG